MIGPSHNQIATEAYCAQRAASIIQLFDKIPDTYPRYSFVFMHPVTSATMILFSIASRNPALATRYGSTLLLAVHFLRSYCQKTWVSGKMIRTVSKLNEIVQAAFNQAANTSEGSVNNQYDQQQREGNHSGEPDRLIPVNASSSEPHNMAPPPNDYQARPNGMMSSPRGHANDMLSPVSNSFGERPKHNLQSRSVSQLSSKAPYRNEASAVWPFTSTVAGAPMGMSNWAATDFDFEEAFNDFSNGQMYDFMGTETFDFDDGWAQSQPLRQIDFSDGL